MSKQFNLHPKLKPIINYSVLLLEKDTHTRHHIIQELMLIKEQYHISNYNLLELGCGLGKNLEVFRHDNFVIGIEGLEEAVLKAKESNLNVFLGNLEEAIHLPDKSQDWILCLDVLEHLVSPYNLMLEIRRLLKDDGRAVINVPNHFDLNSRLKILFGAGLDTHNYYPEHKDWNNPHIRFFTHTGLLMLIEKTGFFVIEDRSSHFPAVPKYKYLMRWGMRSIVKSLIKSNLDLFAGAFFFVLEKEKKDI